MKGKSISHEFPCNNCGAKLHYDAATESMRCKYCAVTQAVPLHGVDIPIEEGIRLASRGFGTPVAQITCNECGASVSIARGSQTAKCAFCGSEKVLAQETSGNPITPKSIVPFKITKEKANTKFKTWLGTLWFRPNDLKKKAELQEMDGVYIPFWMFGALVKTEWTASSGYYYYENEWYLNDKGQRVVREVKKTRWTSSYGDRQDFFDANLICASKGLPQDLVLKLNSFDTDKLTSYQPEFLAGWQAESYVIDLLPAWNTAQKDMSRVQQGRASRDVPGDEQRNLSVRNKFSHVTFQHVLLPIWISTYRYHDKPYQFLVNGQTGEVVGTAPFSFWKIATAIAAVGIGIFALVTGLNK